MYSLHSLTSQRPQLRTVGSNGDWIRRSGGVCIPKISLALSFRSATDVIPSSRNYFVANKIDQTRLDEIHPGSVECVNEKVWHHALENCFPRGSHFYTDSSSMTWLGGPEARTSLSSRAASTGPTSLSSGVALRPAQMAKSSPPTKRSSSGDSSFSNARELRSTRLRSRTRLSNSYSAT